ncbi:MAG: DegT/DnrJ/EryC1/StrS family aminotransferase [Verrucomicrobia bacterium]|nr:DegT/DnrJ/EryC1/StrS family aminotransferase [Verrucomicrobiota bacterium]MCG2679984.1 DegT/DnrJ/EryC1/StrS family aminotransferase [Kiritimatiellia bacterium]MBU4247369.1 DegT/DnrJ/EryC1/StrS family aminotransferase [Verrucomicrobiota bacterium]MBU4290618.1 DegT/DnrJ/EryC1/StrS family aminotransferase [Verrucomicrobiota bacterium]MBU4429221.1 DegT/DnrJ/EryC1/StrS family aminotransferase [Verrucomicrobiota bacterium]
MTKLAILGGNKAVPEGLIKKWPPVDAEDEKLVLASLRSDNHAFGPNCEALVREFAEWNGNKYCLFTNSGTAALHMALAACGVGAGDHVLVTAYSWSASATCILHHNAIPVFVEIDWATMIMAPDKIEAAITPKTKAIVVVHLNGLMVNMEKVMAVAHKHNLKVVEDACQAHGARYAGRKAGTWGDAAAFSLNQNKMLCAGEGGFLVTDNEEIYKAAVQIWNFGENRTPAQSRDYHAYALGWMYRGNDLTAAFARAQLKRLNVHIDIARSNAQGLNRELAGLKGVVLPVEPPNHFHNWYNHTCRVDTQALGWTGNPSALRNAILDALRAEGVTAGVYQHWTLPAMTVFQAQNAYGGGCPWTCPLTNLNGVDYSPERFPITQRHVDTHFGIATQLRAPNGSEVVRAIAEAYQKVLANINNLEIKE